MISLILFYDVVDQRLYIAVLRLFMAGGKGVDNFLLQCWLNIIGDPVFEHFAALDQLMKTFGHYRARNVHPRHPQGSAWIRGRCQREESFENSPHKKQESKNTTGPSKIRNLNQSCALNLFSGVFIIVFGKSFDFVV